MGPTLKIDNPRHVIVVSTLIRNTSDQILLIRHHKRGWEIPQGKVEEGESLIEALHREVLEETGVQVETGKLTRPRLPEGGIICRTARRSRSG